MLYLGDYDKIGHNIRRNIEAALEWYQCESDEFTIPVEVELRLVTVTPEQVSHYNLKGSPNRGIHDNRATPKRFQTSLIRCHR